MATSHKAVKDDKKQLEIAHETWNRFTKFSTAGTIFVIVTLILMALFLV